jgi:hypothetical protein
LDDVVNFCSSRLIGSFFDEDEFERKRLDLCSRVNNIYNKLVNFLVTSADLCILKAKQNFFKFWWDVEGDILKKESISTHEDWIRSGRPGAGLVYDRKRLAKRKYKVYLNKKKHQDNDGLSNQLQDALMNKDTDKFWKSWRCKFGNKNKTNKNNRSFKGMRGNHLIAEKFADLFSKNHGVNSVNKQDISVIDNYLEGNFNAGRNNFNFDVDIISNIIIQLDEGKTPGSDNLSVEHLHYCHPCIIIAISHLFKVFGLLGFVPDAFGLGVVIPIPKSSSYNKNYEMEDYRGITISPVLSKIFEKCILLQIEPLLKTSDRQFGFKKGTGCRDAIFALKSTVSHFINNKSTVNIC